MESKKTSVNIPFTLEQQKDQLFKLYRLEELDWFSLLIQQSNQCLYDEVIRCTISTKEDGSNGK